MLKHSDFPLEASNQLIIWVSIRLLILSVNLIGKKVWEGKLGKTEHDDEIYGSILSFLFFSCFFGIF
jgi:hypothetical protein